jgi:predicted RNase H-like HicB family nuclease
MHYFTFTIVIENESDPAGFLAYSPTLSGCFTRAATIEEARRTIHDTVRRRVESLLAEGQPIRQSDRFLHVEELTVAVPDTHAGSEMNALVHEQAERGLTWPTACRPANDSLK